MSLVHSAATDGIDLAPTSTHHRRLSTRRASPPCGTRSTCATTSASATASACPGATCETTTSLSTSAASSRRCTSPGGIRRSRGERLLTNHTCGGTPEAGHMTRYCLHRSAPSAHAASWRTSTRTQLNAVGTTTRSDGTARIPEPRGDWTHRTGTGRKVRLQPVAWGTVACACWVERGAASCAHRYLPHPSHPSAAVVVVNATQDALARANVARWKAATAAEREVLFAANSKQ